MIRSLFAFAAGALVVVAGCAPPGPSITVHSATLPILGEPCPADGSAGSEFTNEVTGLRLTVSGDGITKPAEADGDVGALTLEGVPAGTNRTVALFGLVGSSPAWRGVTRNVEVKPKLETQVDVLMARMADLTCSRSPDADKRVFHTATVLRDGRILLVGGAKTSTDSGICGGCRQLEAASSAAIYDPTTGQFEATGALAEARMFHTAALLADGRVVIAGGTRRAIEHDPATHPFPVIADQPVSSIEVFDPEREEFSPGGVDPQGARIFAASTATLNGEVIITGGIPVSDLARNTLGNAVNTTTICGGEPLSCRAGPQMRSRRAGHVAFTIDPDGIFVWGGSIDSQNGGFKIEALRDDGQWTILNMNSMRSAHNVFFAAPAQYVSFRMMMAGGLRRADDGTFTLADVALVDGGRGGSVLVYDPTTDVVGGIVDGTFPGDTIPMALQSPRFFAGAAALPGETRALIGGGYRDLNFTPSDELELYDEARLVVEALPVGGVPRTLREARGGLVAAANGDGTVVFTGGEVPDATGVQRTPASTAEIFADRINPPGVAE